MADHKLRLRTHSFYTILLKNKMEVTSFLNAGHAKAYSNLKIAVNFFLFFNPLFFNLKGAANFCAYLRIGLDRRMAMLYDLSTNIHQKFDTRRMDKNYEF